MAVVGFAAKAESNGLFELFHPAVFYGEEDLVRGGVEVEGDPFGGECFFDLFCIEVGGAPHLNIEAIFEKLVKLDAEEPAFGEECAMLFVYPEDRCFSFVDARRYTAMVQAKTWFNVVVDNAGNIAQCRTETE